MAVFTTQHKVMFQHCDPAKIVFYPRYFEMINAVVEEWFDQKLDYSFKKMHADPPHGVPTVTITCDFRKPSYLGDILDFSLRVKTIGSSSFRCLIAAHCDEELRLEADAVLVHIDGTKKRPLALAPETRALMEEFLIQD